ncbi:phage integrase [Pseudomonas poae]|uniref:phage integrase n=1 Tax=Pseudomonas poae TaxID=200451 RepID=UPI0034D50E45
MKSKITQKLIGSLAAEAKAYRVHDTVQPGFFIRVLPSGHKSYMVTWGRNKNATLGRVGVLTLDQARTEAAQYLADAHAHGEPLAIAQGRKGSALPSLRDFIDDTYMPWFKAHHKGHEKTQHTLSNNFDPIMAQRLDAITGRDLEQIRTGWMQAGNKASTVNRKMGSISGVFSRAVEWEYIDTHPLAKLKQLKVDSKGVIRYLAADETKRLRDALDARQDEMRAERESANAWRTDRHKEPMPSLLELPFTDHLKPMVLVSLNTGMRRGELFDLKWSAVNFDTKTITAADLPTSHQGMQDTKGDEFTGRMLGAINSMLVEMMAAIARKDYEQRRERQAQGIEKAKAAGKYQGRPVDADLHKRVTELLSAGLGIRATARHANCSTTTVLRIRDLAST